MEDDGLENLTNLAPSLSAAPPPSPPPSQPLSQMNSFDDDYHHNNNANNNDTTNSVQNLEPQSNPPITSVVENSSQIGSDLSLKSYNTESLNITISDDTTTISSPSYTTADNATPENTLHQKEIFDEGQQQEQEQQLSQDLEGKEISKKSVLFDTVTVYHFTRSQGFSSIPSQGGSTLGMKRRHFLRRKLSVDLYEEVRRRSRREILLKIRLDKRKKKEDCDQLHCNSISSSTSSTSNTTTSSSDSDDESFSDYSDISDSELETDSYIFLQPVGVRLRRSLLRASGVGRIDPKEKKECKAIRESRERSGCKCVNQCIPGLCECSKLGVNCHVDRVSFPCGCISAGCQNPLGRTEFDIKRVKVHLFEILDNQGIG